MHAKLCFAVSICLTALALGCAHQGRGKCDMHGVRGAMAVGEGGHGGGCGCGGHGGHASVDSCTSCGESACGCEGGGAHGGGQGGDCSTIDYWKTEIERGCGPGPYDSGCGSESCGGGGRRWGNSNSTCCNETGCKSCSGECGSGGCGGGGGWGELFGGYFGCMHGGAWGCGGTYWGDCHEKGCEPCDCEGNYVGGDDYGYGGYEAGYDAGYEGEYVGESYDYAQGQPNRMMAAPRTSVAQPTPAPAQRAPMATAPAAPAPVATPARSAPVTRSAEALSTPPRPKSTPGWSPRRSASLQGATSR